MTLKNSGRLMIAAFVLACSGLCAAQTAANDKAESIWQKAIAPESWPNWALVLVGIGATLVAWRTLGDIREQTTLLGQYVRATNEGVDATRKSADAALKSAQAIVNAERPWMIIELTPIPGVPWTGYISFRAWNRGRTPAEITDYQGEFFFHGNDEEFPAEPTFRPWERLYREYISPGNSVFVYGFDLGGSMPPDQWQWMEKEKKRLYFKGRIVYRDLITYEEHETRFCYWLSPADGVGLIMGGDRNWNKYT